MSQTPSHLTNLESALGGLAPSAAGLNRDRLLYEAGKLAAPRRMRWPIAASVFAGLSAVLALQLFVSPAPRTVEVVVYVPTPTPHFESESSPTVVANNDSKWGNAFHSSAGYMSLRDQVLYFGADALPAAPPAPNAPQEPQQELKAWHRSI
jgi:hypothetical protein